MIKVVKIYTSAILGRNRPGNLISGGFTNDLHGAWEHLHRRKANRFCFDFIVRLEAVAAGHFGIRSVWSRSNRGRSMSERAAPRRLRKTNAADNPSSPKRIGLDIRLQGVPRSLVVYPTSTSVQGSPSLSVGCRISSGGRPNSRREHSTDASSRLHPMAISPADFARR